MPDADNDRFNRELKETPPGLRFRLSLREASIAVRMVREIITRYGVIQDPGSTSYARLQAWRRQYIKASEMGSDAIGQLWDQYHWPPNAAATATYHYKPKDPA